MRFAGVERLDRLAAGGAVVCTRDPDRRLEKLNRSPRTVFAFWYWIEWKARAVDRHVEASIPDAGRLVLLARLATPDEVLMSGSKVRANGTISPPAGSCRRT